MFKPDTYVCQYTMYAITTKYLFLIQMIEAGNSTRYGRSRIFLIRFVLFNLVAQFSTATFTKHVLGHIRSFGSFFMILFFPCSMYYKHSSRCWVYMTFSCPWMYYDARFESDNIEIFLIIIIDLLLSFRLKLQYQSVHTQRERERDSDV